jgi:DNA-binding XRE family transcriptional regulator
VFPEVNTSSAAVIGDLVLVRRLPMGARGRELAHAPWLADRAQGGTGAMQGLTRARRNGTGRPSIRQGRFGIWLEDNQIDRERLADTLGINRRHIDHIAREDRRPSLGLALKLERLTGGYVGVAYFAQIPSHRK